MADPKRDIGLGSRGADVRALQRALSKRAATRHHPPVSVDGVLGPNTVFAFRSLGWSLGLLPETLEAHSISVGAQRVIIDPDGRSEEQLDRAKRRARSLHNVTVVLDGTPTFWGLVKPLLQARAQGWGGRLNSADRRKGVAERFGKMSQAALFKCAQAKKATGACPTVCHGNCNPANPPGASSHELRSDAVAFPGPRGRKLQWWELGLDCDDAPQLVAILRRLGYDAARPYASSPREAHHVNFRRSPGRVLDR
jgi:hypothetical protein